MFRQTIPARCILVSFHSHVQQARREERVQQQTDCSYLRSETVSAYASQTGNAMLRSAKLGQVYFQLSIPLDLLKNRSMHFKASYIVIFMHADCIVPLQSHRGCR